MGVKQAVNNVDVSEVSSAAMDYISADNVSGKKLKKLDLRNTIRR
jgi:hypothetical protein